MVESPPLTLRLLGAMEIRIGAESLPALRSQKGYWLLALLALRGERPIQRSWLAGTLWPDSDEEKALVSLRRSLSDLRQALGPEADRLESPTGKTIRLELTGALVDVVRFDRLIKSAVPAELEEAVALYRGPLLEGCTESWVVQERHWREEAVQDARERLAEAARSHGELTTAAAHLRTAVALHPWRETALRLLLTTVAEQGDFAEAVLLYRNLRLHLREHLNAEPSPETQALYRSLRERARTLAGAPTPEAPERRTAVASPGRRAPHPLTRLIGREAELARARTLLAESRLVTVTGIGGVGKTRFSLELAAESDSVCFADLSPLRSAADVPGAIATALGVGERPGETHEEALERALGDTEAFLILDNCEHLQAACARAVRRLLEACPGLRVLATSRQALGIAGERILPLAPLALPRDDTLSSASHLFLERAQAVAPGLTLERGNLFAVARICRALDGIPLALELAAARLRALSLTQLSERIDDRFRLLRQSDPTAEPRQQTLRALIDWSYDLLSDDERLLLRRLSVFTGGWSLEAAESICGHTPLYTGDVLDLLTQLVDKSLVIAQDGRYRFLETVREYSQQRVDSHDEAEELAGRHRTWFRQWVAATIPGDHEPNAGDWPLRIEAERDNLRLALAGTTDPDERLRFVADLGMYWYQRGHYQEGGALLDAALEAAPAGPPRARLRAQRTRALLADRLGDIPTMVARAADACALADTLDDSRLASQAYRVRGMAAKVDGRYADAKADYLRSVELARAVGDRLSEIRSTGNMALIDMEEGRLEAARELQERNHALAIELGDIRSEISALGNRASIAFFQGDDATAERLWRECLVRDRAVGYPWGIIFSLINLAQVATRSGDLSAGLDLFREALRESYAVEDVVLSVDIVEEIARLLAREGNAAGALRLYHGAHAARRRRNVPVPPARAAERESNIAALRAAIQDEQIPYIESGERLTLEALVQEASGTLSAP